MKNLILIVGAVAICGILCLVGLSGFLRRQATAPLAQPPSHGVSFLLEIDNTPAAGATNNLAALKAALLKRADRAGVQIYWEPISEAQVRVMVATGLSENVDRLQRALFRQGRLELRLVHEQSGQLIEVGEMPPGHELLKHEQRKPPGAGRVDKVIVRKKPEAGLSGSVVKKAAVMRSNLGEPEIYFTLQPEAAAAFARTTRDSLGRQLAIVVDGELYSAPTIQSPIENGEVVITGQFDIQEATQFAATLEYPLPFSVKVAESKNY